MSGSTDKAAGMANEAAGKVKQGVGKAVGSDKLQAEALDRKQREMRSSLKATQRMRSRTALIKWPMRQTRSFECATGGRLC